MKQGQSNCVVIKINNEDNENTHQQYTRDVIDFVKSFGIPCILKLVPSVNKPAYTVDVSYFM